jgi:hypothetical protein
MPFESVELGRFGRVRRRRPGSRRIWASGDAPLPVFDRGNLPPAHAQARRLESRSVGRKEKMLEPAMLMGLGLVAVWTYSRYPRLRPRSLLRAILHVAISFAGFALLPLALSVLIPLTPSQQLRPYLVLALLIPTLTYVLLTWVWLLARIWHDYSGGSPRGGHPVSTET